jgi:hypothetical protein
MEEAVAAGLVVAGRTPPNGLTAKVDALGEEYDDIGEHDAILPRWAEFDPQRRRTW